MQKMASIDSKLHQRKKLGNLRELQIAPPLIDFASGDYLGLAKSPVFLAAFQQKIQSLQKIGSCGSRLLTGNTLLAQELEERIASFHGYEAGLLFGCGYMANVGLLSAIAEREDRILFDACSHASTRDGIHLSRAKGLPFRHNDLNHLENRLRILHQGATFICIESVYSTDGSIAPLPEIHQLGSQYGARLIVDEAHATGVLGPSGRGLVATSALQDQLFAQITTFGKALGAYGAIVLGRRALKQTLLNFANSFIYTTAPSLPLLAAIQCSYDLFPSLDAERAQLLELTRPFPCKSHIQSIPIQGNQQVKDASLKLAEHGFDVRPLMSPTVRRGHEALRLCLHSFNTAQQLERLMLIINILT